MKKAAFVLLFILISTASYGQVSVPGVVVSVAPSVFPMPAVGPSMTAVDRMGNLYIFEVTYTYPAPLDANVRIIRVPPTIQSKVTIVSSEGSVLSTNQYDGYYQLLGAGQHAVYAAVTTYSAASTATIQAMTSTRKLLAFIGTAPTVEAPISLAGDVRLNPSVDNRPDVISVLDYLYMPLLTAGGSATTAPARQRQGQLIKFNGGAFDVKMFTIPQ